MRTIIVLTALMLSACSTVERKAPAPLMEIKRGGVNVSPIIATRVYIKDGIVYLY